ncbi:MAG: PDZ domain-containing protein [Acidobacteria bacterium]|nr:PDZ domain-containing protein [Acidobacteriota bacterium]
MRRLSLLVCLLSFLGSHLAVAVEAPFPRHPAPSPDGSMLVFSWQGDLWKVPTTGGTAHPLTLHPDAERFPVWSRDGRWIAFASDRYGSLDVFVMPSDASRPPLRLTFASTDDVPVDFTPDCRSVVFTSRRDEAIRWMSALYTVPVDGGTPALLQPALGQDAAAYSPQGTALVFVRGATKWTRRGYRGAANRDLWLRTADGDYVQLTHFDGDDDCPSWIGPHTVAFLSARAGRKNVFSLETVTGQATQLTNHDGSDVRAPRASADGSVIAYEFENGIWTVTLGGGTPKRVHIDVPAGRQRNTVERGSARDSAGELAVSPDGTLAAFTAHGDVYVAVVRSKEDQEIAPPPTVRITANSFRDHDIAWSPDGSALVFSADDEGNDDLYLARPRPEGTEWADALDFDIRRLTSSAAEEHGAVFSPDGTRLAFIRGKGNLVVMKVDGGTQNVLLEHWETPEFAWSPDGQWLAYSIPDVEYNTDVWVVPAAGGKPYNVSRHPDEDLQPRWSPDGRRLLWLSKRHADTLDVWGVWLTKADDERTAEGWLKLWKAGAAAKKPPANKDEPAAAGSTGAKGGKKTEPGAELSPVTIDFDNLWERAKAITDLKGDEGAPLASPDGKRIVFTAEHEGKRDLYSVRFDGKDITKLTNGGQEPTHVQMTKNGKAVFYLDKKGRIKRTSLGGKAGDPVPFAARYEVDPLAQHGQVFDEAWRALNEWFYDPAFHGVDWAAQREKYRPWLYDGMSEQDFADLVNLMLGELNASHMGYYPKRPSKPEETGFIGALFDPASGGPGVVVREVLPDGPAARQDVRLAAGDRLLSVNGTLLDEHTNIYGLFADTVGHRVPIRIRTLAGAERSAVVIPVNRRSEFQLRYREWVRERRQLVDAMSNGRLGYLHVQGMNIPSFEEFERDLYAAGHGKEGLIIDVRSNGGGWTTDYLMAVLDVRRHAFTIPRDAPATTRAYPQGRLPLAAWTRPALTLCNSDSYSNAEIFSHAFKTLHRGPLVGTPTFGAVISTGGQRLLNGGWVRLPLRGWYVATTGVNMEHHGAVPDVVVAQPPAEDTSHDTDTQLARAVQVLLEDIPSDPQRADW